MGTANLDLYICTKSLLIPFVWKRQDKTVSEDFVIYKQNYSFNNKTQEHEEDEKKKK